MERKATKKEIEELEKYMVENGFSRNPRCGGIMYLREYNYGHLQINFDCCADGRTFKHAEAFYKFDVFDICQRKLHSRRDIGKRTRCPDAGWVARTMKYSALMDGAFSRFIDAADSIEKESKR